MLTLNNVPRGLLKMTDQCMNCTLKGDLPACKAIECSHHENWYAVEQQKRIDELEEKLLFLVNNDSINDPSIDKEVLLLLAPDK